MLKWRGRMCEIFTVLRQGLNMFKNWLNDEAVEALNKVQQWNSEGIIEDDSVPHAQAAIINAWFKKSMQVSMQDLLLLRCLIKNQPMQ
jgi:hypothetical protein